METSAEPLGKGPLSQTAEESFFFDLEALEHLADLIRKGHRVETDGWARLVHDIHAVWPVASKGSFRLWKVSGFPSISTNL